MLSNIVKQESKRFSRIGVVGGMGPETSFNFCLNLNNRFRSKFDKNLDLVLEQALISKELELKFIRGEESDEVLSLLIKTIERLNKDEVDFIVIPCNTAHIFIDDLRKISNVPIISIIEECSKECKKRDWNKMGLLASSESIKEKIHQKSLEKENIEIIIPNIDDQKKVDEIILRLIHNEKIDSDKDFLIDIIRKFNENGVKGVILGCTDLDLLLSEINIKIPLFSTLKILENSIIETFIGGPNVSIKL